MGFSQVTILTTLGDQKLVQWTMDSSRGLPADVEFYVDKARAGGEFIQVGGPLENSCLFVDEEPWNWNKDKNSFYRIRYQSGLTWVESDAVQANGNWSRRDHLLAKELARKECVRMREVGVSGMVFKRREWGTPCPRCADFDTHQPADGQCPICFGTGLEHGYYRPMQLAMDLSPLATERKESEIGTVQPDAVMGRCINYPMLASFDIWANTSSNERYTIRKVQNVAAIRGRPVVAQVELRLIPQTDVRYTLQDEVAVPEPGQPSFGWDQLNVV
jgi:hypothetical protein